MRRIVLWVLLVLAVLLAALGIAIVVMQGPAPEQAASPVHFRPVPLAFRHRIDLDRNLPFMGSAVLDVDGDGRDELLLGGGDGQADALFRFETDRFVDMGATGIDKPATSATFGYAVLDADGDGRSDVFAARSDGVYLHRNLGRDAPPYFASARIDFALDANTSPLSIALADVDHDGDVDLFVAGYIRHDQVEGETIFNRAYGGYSYLLRNDGDGRFTDIAAQAGLRRQHNTFIGAFADIDNDGWADLLIAQDTGVVEIQRNLGDGRFAPLDNPTLHYASYPMGIALGDLDQDGDTDFWFSNVGPTLPKFMLRGDLRAEQVLHTDYILLRNEAGARFTDVANERHAARLGFGWGTLMHDLDNDGREDLLTAQNYARFPGVRWMRLYRGHFLRQRADGSFVASERDAGIENAHFGITPLVGDFNGDGWPDLTWANLDGPALAFINAGNANAWLQVRLADGAAGLNARVQVTRADGQRLHAQAIVGEGLGSTQTRWLQFGLGSDDGPVRIDVDFADGRHLHGDAVPARSRLELAAPAADAEAAHD